MGSQESETASAANRDRSESLDADVLKGAKVKRNSQTDGDDSLGEVDKQQSFSAVVDPHGENSVGEPLHVDPPGQGLASQPRPARPRPGVAFATVSLATQIRSNLVL